MKTLDRQVPRKPRLVGGVKGHNQNVISFPRSPALWAGSFTCGHPRIQDPSPAWLLRSGGGRVFLSFESYPAEKADQGTDDENDDVNPEPRGDGFLLGKPNH
jgi:hypothetical protein